MGGPPRPGAANALPLLQLLPLLLLSLAPSASNGEAAVPSGPILGKIGPILDDFTPKTAATLPKINVDGSNTFLLMTETARHPSVCRLEHFCHLKQQPRLPHGLAGSVHGTMQSARSWLLEEGRSVLSECRVKSPDSIRNISC